MNQRLIVFVLIATLLSACQKPGKGNYVLELNGVINDPVNGRSNFSREYDYVIKRSSYTSINFEQNCPEYYSTTYSILSRKVKKVWGPLQYFWGDQNGSRKETLHLDGKIVNGTRGDVIHGTFTGDLDMSSSSPSAYKNYYEGTFKLRPK